MVRLKIYVPVGWRDYARSGNTLLKTLVSRGGTIVLFSDKWGGKIVPLIGKATLFHQFQIT